MALRAVELYNDDQSANDSDGLITGPLPGLEGDLVLVAAVINNGSATMTLTDDGDAGNTWSTISSPAPDVISSNTDVYVWAKVLTAGDVGATVTIDASIGGIRFVGLGIALSGRSAVLGDIETGRAQDTSAGSTLAAAGVTTPDDGFDVVNIYLSRSALATPITLSSPGSGQTLAGQSNTNFSASPNYSVAATYATNVSAGPNGAVSATFNQNVTGIIWSVGVPLGSTDYTKTPADDAGLDDVVTLGRSGVASDDLGLGDDHTAVLGAAATEADDLDGTDAATIELAAARTAADDLTADDAVTWSYQVHSDWSATVDGDTNSTGGAITDTPADDLGLTDSVALDVPRDVADDLGLTDGHTADLFEGILDYLATGEDLLLADDEASATLGTERAPTDSAGLTDAPSWGQQVHSEFSATVDGDTDAATGGTDYTKFPSDSAGLTDAAATGRSVPPAQGLGLTDEAAWSYQVHSEFSATVDGDTSGSGEGIGQADALGATDAVAWSLQVHSDWSEAVEGTPFDGRVEILRLTDAVTIERSVELTVADDLGIAETLGGEKLIPDTSELLARPVIEAPTGVFTTPWLDNSPAAETTYDFRDAEFQGYFWADAIFGFGTFADGLGGTTATAHEQNITPFRVAKTTPGDRIAIIGGKVLGDQDSSLTWNSMKHGSHIQQCYDDGGDGTTCTALIVDNQNQDGDPRAYVAEGSWLVVDGLRVYNTHDGFGIYSQTDSTTDTGTVYMRNTWIKEIHDDAIENDRAYLTLFVEDCLFEDVYGFISVNDTAAAPDPSKAQTVTNSVISLLPRNGPYQQPSSATGHGYIYKMDAQSPPLVMNNVIVAVSKPAQTNRLDLPDRAGLDSYTDVTIVWLGEGDYPGNVPAGCTVTTDEAVLTEAVASWKARHGVTDFDTVDMELMLAPTESAAARVLSETLSLADAVTLTRGYGCSPADAIGADDEVTRLAAIVRSSADSVGLLDSAASDQGGGQTQDALGLTDAVSVTFAAVRTVADLLSIRESPFHPGHLAAVALLANDGTSEAALADVLGTAVLADAVVGTAVIAT